jgi:transposase
MTMSSDDAMTSRAPARRIEIFTGAGQRRSWSVEEKARIVAESYSGAISVCDVARR